MPSYPLAEQAMCEQYNRSLVKHLQCVREAGMQIGIPARQLLDHDRSKYSNEEFMAYAGHFYGGGDPEAFARAWLHHIHHNPHHWQHWIFPDGHSPAAERADWIAYGVLKMPKHYALEMVADWMGASKAYTGEWDMAGWLKKNLPRIRVHPETAVYVGEVLTELGYGDIVQTFPFGSALSMPKAHSFLP